MSDPTEEVPRILRLLWDVAEPARRGPKPAHSVSEIADVAVGIADRDGLAAASLPRVARELGAATTSLYRYLETRADLDAAMLDRAYGRPPVHRGRREWRPRLRSWALANLAVLRSHQWVLDIPSPDPPLGPNRTAWTEAGLACFDGTAVPLDHQLEALLLIEMFVRGQAQLARTNTAHAALAPARMSYSAQLAAVIGVAERPRLTNAVAQGAFDRAVDPLAHGLDIVLDGLGPLLSAPATEAQ